NRIITIKMIQFHPEYTYENFVECLRITNKNGQTVLEPVPQIFRDSCKAASESLEGSFNAYHEQHGIPPGNFRELDAQKHVLIIDEINRGDLSRIFGEAILGLEYRDMSIKTMYFEPDNPLIIPNNLYIIGTMNSVDRSIALVDYALRRRFLFFNVCPSKEILEEWLDKNRSQVKQEILQLFQEVNSWIENRWKADPQSSENYKIGHTFFFHKDAITMRDEW
nr:AAA family ATPase [Candidatus Sigynarchaeota archaeon]